MDVFSTKGTYKTNYLIFQLLLDGLQVSEKYLKLNNSGSSVEMLIVESTYTSLIINTCIPSISDKVDRELRYELNDYIKHHQLNLIIEDSFHSVQTYLRDRVNKATHQLKHMLIGNPDNYDETSLPVDLFRTVINNPLKRIESDLSNPEMENIMASIQFSKLLLGLIRGLNDTLPNAIYNQYLIQISPKLLNFELIDFDYYALFEDYCPYCGGFYERVDMIKKKINDFDLGFSADTKICRNCDNKENFTLNKTLLEDGGDLEDDSSNSGNDFKLTEGMDLLEMMNRIKEENEKRRKEKPGFDDASSLSNDLPF